MKYLLLIVCSIISARFLEKKYKVASIAHTVLFVLMSFIYLTSSEIPMIQFAMKNILTEPYYIALNEIISETIFGFHIGVSTLFIVEFITYTIVSIVSVFVAIKTIKGLVKRVRLLRNHFNRSLASTNRNLGLLTPCFVNDSLYHEEDSYIKLERFLI